MKTGLKIIYVIIAFLVCLFAYFLSYSNNMYTYIYNITSDAIESKNYVETAMIHGGCFEKVDLVNQSDDNVNVAIFRSTSLSEYSYTNESDESVEVDKYEFSYYIYIYPGDKVDSDGNPISIDYSDYSDNTNTYNKSGIKFYNGEESYTYYFKISDSINSSLYVESPTSYNSAILNSSRDWLEYNDNYGFINFTFEQSLLNAINETNDNKFDKITKIEILNSHGEVKRTIEITLDFDKTEGFFHDVERLTTAYTNYLEIYNSDASDDEKETAESDFSTFSDSFQTEFLAENTNYTLRHDDSYLQPSSITWQSVGTTALFVICAILIYFLLFHFAFIKGIFNKNSQKYDRYKTHNGAKAGAIISANNPKSNNKKSSESVETIDQNKDETVSKEEVTEILSSNQDDNEEIVKSNSDEVSDNSNTTTSDEKNDNNDNNDNNSEA